MPPASERARGRPVGAAAAALALAVAIGLSAAASAHHGEPAMGGSEPGEFGDQSELGVSTDSEHGYGTNIGVPVVGTVPVRPVGGPVPKPGEEAGWLQVAGSRWDEDGRITQMAVPFGLDGSPTPYDLDFYGVDFLGRGMALGALLADGLSGEEAAEAATAAAKSNGFAVGAECRRSDPDEPVAQGEVAGCERIPVVYRFYEHPRKGLLWEESYRGSDANDRGGFAAAVAWLSPERVLVVGGTGTYPRRESEREADEDDAAYAGRDAECADTGKGSEPGQCAGAGMARA